MAWIDLEKIDEAKYKVLSDEPKVFDKLYQYFSYEEEGAAYAEAYKNNHWDGISRLFSNKTHLLYSGLTHRLPQFCKDNDIELRYTPQKEKIDSEAVMAFIRSLGLPDSKPPRDYQLAGLLYAIRNKNLVLFSAVNSGKSLIIYMLIKWLLEQGKQNILFIVPRIHLITQICKNFDEFGLDSNRYCHQIYAGQDKNSDKPIKVACWQSLFELEKKHFHQYDAVIVDETHNARGKSLRYILSNCANADYRIGLTGSLAGKTNQLLVEACLGKTIKISDTKTLQERGISSQLTIRCNVLKHREAESKEILKRNWEGELETILGNEKRNKIITEYVKNLEGNTIVFFQRIEQHGHVLHRMFKEAIKDRPIYYIDGKTDMAERERIRLAFNEQASAIGLVSDVFVEGVDIPNIDNGVFTSPTKSERKILQSVGRILRVGRSSTAGLHDFIDEYSYGGKTNYSYKHFLERLKVYAKEKQKFIIKYFNV